MPKLKVDKVEEPKKKMVVVEEVLENEEPKKDEVVKETIVPVPDSVEQVTVPVEVVTEEPEEKMNYFFIIIPTALLVGALVGGLITYFSGLSRLQTVDSTPTPFPTSAPSTDPTLTASPSSTLKRDELKAQVLNGSGVSGAAGKAKTLLEDLGYKNVDTGNASVSDLAQTEVAIKDTKKEFLDLVIKDLAKSYTAVKVDKALVTTSKYDVVITIGRK